MNKPLFIIDIASCTGCHACSVACKDRANLPDELDLLRAEEQIEGTYPEIDVSYRITHCFHCDDPACVEACPTSAMEKQEDGLVTVQKDKCIGCGECVDSCPFDSIVLHDDKATKCDGCADEVAEGWDPVCVRACPMRALRYESPGHGLLRNRIQDPDFDDHGIEPSVMYLRRRSGGRPEAG